eukprot:CAMPEP_0178881172 /NCGR_PEP_ID=MMETSP0747-20121128/12862_1 /TAXON_ID=913974 /ORGANISM="Nitzschia punctata, Strain CCMP561" /LENGTH=205 /DNA_ID=CAMNT_0020549129 /DNA_START=328 /DNA_END=942 /DNA_ORIENTATION=-
MRAALDEAKGTDAFFHVFVAARNALDIVAATSLRGSGTATLGRNEAAIAAKAGDLAAFSSVLVSSAAAPTRFGRHRKATGPTKTQTICRRLAAALDVLGVTCCRVQQEGARREKRISILFFTTVWNVSISMSVTSLMATRTHDTVQYLYSNSRNPRTCIYRRHPWSLISMLMLTRLLRRREARRITPMAEADFVCNVDRFWTSAS